MFLFGFEHIKFIFVFHGILLTFLLIIIACLLLLPLNYFVYCKFLLLSFFYPGVNFHIISMNAYSS